MAEVVLEGVGAPINNDGNVVIERTGAPVGNDPGVVPGAVGPPLNNDFFPGFGAEPPGTIFPGFGPAPPNIAQISDAGNSGLASQSNHTHGGGPASWTLSGRRYIAIDNDLGNDSSTNYFSDVDMASAFAGTPLKTVEGLDAVLPRLGSGRQIVVAFKPRAGGAVYKKQDGVTNADLIWRGFTGYRSILLEGTTDGSNSATDKMIAGAVVASAGPNVDSSWTVGAGATTVSVPLNAGAFPADPAISLKRVRWLTGVLTGTVTWVRKQNTASFEPGEILASPPAQGDTFLVEQPGVAFSKVQISGDGASVNSSPEQTGVEFVMKGIAATSNSSSAWAVRGPLRRIQIGFCESRGGSNSRTNWTNCGTIRPANTVTDETGATISVGSGYRESGAFSALDSTFFFANSTGSIGTSTVNLSGLQRMQYFTGRIRGGVKVSGNGSIPVSAPTLIGAGDLCLLGNQAATQNNERFLVDGPIPAIGLVQIVSCSLGFHGVELINAGALPAIRVNAVNCSIRLDDVIGSAGNTDVGLDLTGASGACVQSASDNPNTVSGTAGDIRQFGGRLPTWTSLNTINSTDSRANNVYGTGGVSKQTVFKLSGKHTGGVGAVTEFLADSGAQIAALALAQNYPSPATRYRNLRVKPLTNSLVATTTVTILKNNVATALLVTVGAGSTAVVSDLANEALFDNNDLFDVQVTSTAGGIANSADLSVMVEGG